MRSLSYLCRYIIGGQSSLRCQRSGILCERFSMFFGELECLLSISASDTSTYRHRSVDRFRVKSIAIGSHFVYIRNLAAKHERSNCCRRLFRYYMCIHRRKWNPVRASQQNFFELYFDGCELTAVTVLRKCGRIANAQNKTKKQETKKNSEQ